MMQQKLQQIGIEAKFDFNAYLLQFLLKLFNQSLKAKALKGLKAKL